MGKTVACIIARTFSSRLEKKVLRDVHGKRFIEHIIQKMKYVDYIDEIYLCTSVDEQDTILLGIAEENGIRGYAGSRESPIDRMLAVAETEGADNVIRVTGDNIFTDEIFLQKMIEEHMANPGIDYTRTEFLPLGVTAEVMSVEALKRCYDMMDPNQSQYLMIYMFAPSNFNCQVVIPEENLKAEFTSLTVDTPEDFERTLALFDALYKNGRIYYDDIIGQHAENPIPNFEMDKSITLKMPNKGQITYGQLREMMRERIERSRKVILENGFYESRKV